MEQQARYELIPNDREPGALIDIEQSRAMSEVQSAMIIAKRFRRNHQEAVDRIEMACARQSLAEVALYEYSRGGTAITGPSIRLAEALAQNWGNLQFGIRELDQRDGVSTVEAFAWDLETNTRQSKTFQVAHKRHTKKGAYALEDPRDIYEMVANQGARRLRACILGIIPGDVVETAVKQCETTLRTKAEVTPERIKSLLDKFAQHGVTKDQLEKRIQRRIDAMTPALMVNLGKIYNSLKDGMSTPASWFEIANGESVSEPGSLKDRMEKAKAKPTPAKEEPATDEPEPEPPPTDPATPPEPTKKKEGWRDEFEIATRWKACIDKNKGLTRKLLKQYAGYDNFNEVPMASKLDVLAAIEGEVLG